MESRFVRQISNLRTYFRKRGAVIDAKRKTVKVDIETLNRKELDKLEELERWGYEVNKSKLPSLPFRETETKLENEVEESFIDFADEIINMYQYY